MSQSPQQTIKQTLSRAKKAAKQGDTAIAMELYNTILQTHPSHPIAKKALQKLQRVESGHQPANAQAIDPPPNQLNSLINIYQKGQIKATEQACRVLLQTYPQSLTVISILAATLNAQGRFEAALVCYDRFIQIKPNLADAHNNRGSMLSKLGQINEAIKSFKKAIRLKSDFLMAYNNLANMYNQLCQADEAKSCLEKSIQIKPDFVEAHCNLAKLKKFTENDPQIPLMEKLYLDAQLSEENRIHLCFSLAKAFEDFGDFNKSFHYLEEGNNLHKKISNYDINSKIDELTKVRKAFSAKPLVIDNLSDEETSIQPLFIVGMPRSGTSLVEQILASHTKVHGAGELESIHQLISPILSSWTHQDQPSLSAHEIKYIRNGYLKDLVDLNVPEMIIVDKMPINFRWIGFILSAFPKAKIIHLNRDPIATCWSIYKYNFSGAGNNFAYNVDDLTKFYSLYVEMISFWRARYPDNIYDISYENLTENQEEETRRLLSYCNLEWEENCLNFHESERVVKTASAYQVRKKMYKGSSDAWKKYEHHLQPLINGLKIHRDRGNSN